jgi:flagellar biosynthesis/type III secretory pathway protein FliH
MHTTRADHQTLSHPGHHTVSHVHRFNAPTFAPPATREDVETRLRAAHAMAEEAGRADGYAAGLAAARVEIDALVAQHQAAIAEAATIASALSDAVRQVEQADRVSIGELERSIVETALELATEIVGREVLLDGAAMAAIRTAAGFAPERHPMVVRVHPLDADAVRDELFLLDLPIGSSVASDPTVGRGQCVLDIGQCRIDHQVAGALTRMRGAVAAFYGDATSVRLDGRGVAA